MPKVGVKIPKEQRKMPILSTNKLVRLSHFCMLAPSLKNHHQKKTHCWCPRLVHWCGNYTSGAAKYQYHINNINIKYFWGPLNINNIKDFGDLDHDDDMMTPSKLP